ncbi:uncharacterized protein [Clytia hemisphaerica]|uniref:uncharacterized protein n=1 Tax=Clytia hemisphaerica TaxID=252671 RepID=UPI0034D56885
MVKVSGFKMRDKPALMLAFLVYMSILVQRSTAVKRYELDCSKIYEVQTIGVLEKDWAEGSSFATGSFFMLEPFRCGGKVISVNPPDLTIKNKMTSTDTEKTYTFLNGVSSEELIFKNGDRLFPVGTLTMIGTPGQDLESADGQLQTEEDSSFEIELRVVVGYTCSKWENDTFCYPPHIGSNVGVTISDRTCDAVVPPFKDTVQIQTTPCNSTYEWKSWSDWSKCEPINATESLYGDGTRYRTAVDCQDENGEKVDDYWCGENATIYHLNSCYVFNETEYQYSDYFWSEMSECEIYRPELQGVPETNEQCGNGFQYSNQTYCTMGEYQEHPPQNESLCPPAGYIVKACYVPCKGAGAVSSTLIDDPNQIKLHKPNSQENWTLYNFNEAYPDNKADDLHGFLKFHPASDNEFDGTDKLVAEELLSKQVELQVYFSRFVKVKKFAINLYTMDNFKWKLLLTTDQTKWWNITSEETRNPNSSPQNLLVVDDIQQIINGLKVELEFDSTPTNELKAELNRIDYYNLGDWTEWGSWGDCSGNCRLENSTYERIRTCSQGSDSKNCVGRFVEMDNCKCKEDFQWKAINTTFSPCNATKDECGPGWRYKTADVCQYIIDGSSHPEELCGEKPIITQNCYHVCPALCTNEMASNTESNLQINGSSTDIYQLTDYKEDIFVSRFGICSTNINPTSSSPSHMEIDAMIKVGYFLPLFPNGDKDCEDESFVKVEGGFFKSNPPIDSTYKMPFCKAPQWGWVNSSCSVSCGVGYLNSTVVCMGADGTTHPDHYCPFEEDLEPKILECVNNVSCYDLTEWTDFSSCGGGCGINGTQNQTRECLRDGEPIANYAECISLGKMDESTEFLNVTWCYNENEPCAFWGNWSDWTTESETCGNYTETSQRDCLTDAIAATLSKSTVMLQWGTLWQPDSNHWCGIETFPSPSLNPFSFEGGRYYGAVNYSSDTSERMRMVYTNTSCFKWDKWKRDGECSVTCGEGVQKYTRDCLDGEGNAIDEVSCHELYDGYGFKGNLTGKCSFNFTCTDPVTDWTEWSTCTTTCGGGQTKRTRKCIIPGSCNHLLEEHQLCNEDPCVVDGRWSDWSKFSECSVSCGNGTQFRTRTCFPPLHGGLDCVGNDTDVQSCDTDKPCPAVLMVAEDCSKVCDDVDLACDPEFFKGMNHLELASRLKINCATTTTFQNHTSHPSYDTSNETCLGFKNIGSYDCSIRAPGNGEKRVCGCISKDEITMGPWSRWGECSTSCGVGNRTRSRDQVTSDDETETYTQLGTCSERPCPIDGEWGQWTAFGPCSVECGPNGYQVRTRQCNDPLPMHGGRECMSPETNEGAMNMSDIQDCDYNVVPSICPVHGGWSTWKPVSNCSMSCRPKNSTEKIYSSYARHCDSPAPEFGGNKCDGETIKKVECTGVKECIPVDVTAAIKITDRDFTKELDDLQSEASLDIQNEIQKFVNKVYEKELAKDKNYVKVVLHGFSDGTGVEAEEFGIKKKGKK